MAEYHIYYFFCFSSNLLLKLIIYNKIKPLIKLIGYYWAVKTSSNQKDYKILYGNSRSKY